ncbi:Uncharacterized protein SCF082_LOCUS38220 [Durusdinium trenchii]|uniref:Ribosomal RNA small subunit methyltransferase E methyltransferase domain-containing protein n=1 Tax=Durusdinium trenchii TaxID=1381693 RepID=A0ABP0PWZ6_9DINO
MGVYRALQEMGIMEQLDGISSVSGGTWASSIYMFAREFQGEAIEASALLGARTRPEHLTLQALREEAPPMARGITKGNSSQLLWQYAGSHRDNEVWAHVVADLILQPFGLESFECCVAESEEEVKRIKEENPGIQGVPFHVPRRDRPKLFVMNGALLAPSNHGISGDSVVSFQMSPDYSGSPFYPKDQVLRFTPDVTYQPVPLCCIYPCWRKALTLSIGGGFIETFAFGGDAPEAEAQRGGKVEVPTPDTSFSLPEMVGISSYAPASSFSNRLLTSWWLNIRKKYWAICSNTCPSAQEAHEYQMGDGGAIDNSGLLPLLQRRSRKVIWIASSYRPLQDYDFEGATIDNFDPDAAGVIDQLSSLFGYGLNDQDEGYFYANNQVFKKSQLLPICRKLFALKSSGKPMVLKESLDVLPNSYWGIRGDYQVSFVLIYLDECAEFQQQLPQEVRDEIAKGPNGMLENYPIYKTTGNNKEDMLGLNTAQVNLLAAQGEYAVRQNAHLFRELREITLKAQCESDTDVASEAQEQLTLLVSAFRVGLDLLHSVRNMFPIGCSCFGLEPSEVSQNQALLAMSDRRARHVAKVLQLRDGDALKVGILDGPYDDRAVVRWRWPASGGRWRVPERRQLRPERLSMEEIEGALDREEVLPEFLELHFSAAVECLPRFEEAQVDLLLVPPPLDRLTRLLPQLVQLGIGTLALCQVPGGDREVFHCHLLRSERKLRELLVNGLEQSGQTQVPVLRQLRSSADVAAFAHSGAWEAKLSCFQGTEAAREPVRSARWRRCGARLLLAVGPDGGWQSQEAEESRIVQHCERKISCGSWASRG